MVNDELNRIWNEEIVAKFTALSGNFRERPQENREQPHQRVLAQNTELETLLYPSKNENILKSPLHSRKKNRSKG
jgi:hypothetical protein